MKYLKYSALVSAFALLTSLGALARDSANAKHSLTLADPVQVGNAQLQPGDYKVEWQGTGPSVQVNFVQHGKTVATVPATLQTNDKDVVQDDVITDANGTPKALKEIDFGRQKEALVFTQPGM
jgi:hypothetical protein